MCCRITPAEHRRIAVLGVILLLLTPQSRALAQENPGEQSAWAPAKNTLSVGRYLFLEDGESGERIGIWWTAGRNLSIGVTGRAWDGYEVFEPEVRLQGRRQRRVSPFISLSGFRQLHGSRRGTGVGASLGVEGYPVQGLALYGAVGGRTIWKEQTSGVREGERKRSSWFRVHTGISVFPFDAVRAVTTRDRSSAGGGHRVQVSGGAGFSYPDLLDRDGYGEGAGLSLEFVSIWTRWFSGRLYAGGVFSRADTNSCPRDVQPCSVSSQIAVAGAKIRLLVPLPNAGPFFEMGAGLSAGFIETSVGRDGIWPSIEESDAGLMTHLPLSFGIAFGPEHQHDISFDYFIHRGRKHVACTIALAIGFVWGGN